MGTGYLLPMADMHIPLASGGNYNPTDAQTVYWARNHNGAPSTSAGLYRIRMPSVGRWEITEVILDCVNAASPTAETATFSILVNGTTDYIVDAAQVIPASAGHLGPYTGLSIILAPNDYFECKHIWPTWTTNPTSLTFWGYVVARRIG